MRATRGARNPNLQVVITHALHVCSKNPFDLRLRISEIHKPQFDHLRFVIIPFKYALLTKREVSMTWYVAKFLSCILLDFLDRRPLFFPGWLCHKTWLCHELGRLRDLMQSSSLRSLLRTYERSTYSKSSILFSDTKSGPKKKRTTPILIYTTCTSPIMHLICPPKFCISIIFNFFWDGCNTQEKWKTTWKIMQILKGQIKCIMGEMHWSGESSYLDRTRFSLEQNISLNTSLLAHTCGLEKLFALKA